MAADQFFHGFYRGTLRVTTHCSACTNESRSGRVPLKPTIQSNHQKIPHETRIVMWKKSCLIASGDVAFHQHVSSRVIVAEPGTPNQGTADAIDTFA